MKHPSESDISRLGQEKQLTAEDAKSAEEFVLITFKGIGMQAYIFGPRNRPKSIFAHVLSP